MNSNTFINYFEACVYVLFICDLILFSGICYVFVYMYTYPHNTHNIFVLFLFLLIANIPSWGC